MTHKCPGCGKEFEEIKQVVSNSLEPYTAIVLAPLDLMACLEAWGAIWQEKEVICQRENFVHFRFADNGEERLVEMLPYEPEKLRDAHEANAQKEVVCQHEGCESKETSPYYMSPLDTEPHAYYCGEHAYEEGFCTGCEQFLMGFESFDFSPGRRIGLCAGCYHGLQEEIDDEWEDYDDWNEY